MVKRISVDDGSVEDLRVLELLKKYNLCEIATFYIAPNNPQVVVMGNDDIVECSRYVDIGGHNLDHITINLMDDEDMIDQMQSGRDYLENLIKRKITKYAPTRGWHNDRMIENAKKIGFEEFRTMKQGCTSQQNDFVQNITVHFHSQHIDKFDELLLQSRQDLFGYFHLTCHGWEIEKFKMWDKFENCLQKIYGS